MDSSIQQFLDNKDTLSVKSQKDFLYTGQDNKSQNQFYKGQFNMPTPDQLNRGKNQLFTGNNSFKSNTFSTVYQQSFSNNPINKKTQPVTERNNQKLLQLKKDTGNCKPSQANIQNIQNFFEQKLLEIQQLFSQKDQKFITQFFVDNLDYFEHTFGLCLCFKCDCGLCKCFYEQKEQHKIKMKGQFKTNYQKDFENNKDLAYKQLIMQKLSKNPPGVNPRDLQGFNPNNQAIEKSYMTNNRHEIPKLEEKKDYKQTPKKPSTQLSLYKASYYDYQNLDQFAKMNNIPHFNNFRGLQFNSKVPFGYQNDNSSLVSRNKNFINEINTISQIFPSYQSLKTTNNCHSVDFSNQSYKDLNSQFQSANKISQNSLESFCKLEGDAYTTPSRKSVNIQNPSQCKYENQRQIHDAMKQQLLERLQNLKQI